MKDIIVGYSVFSNLFGVVDIYYQSLSNGTFTLWAVTDDLFVTCYVTASADITDFTTNHQSSSTSVSGGGDEARLLGTLANTVTLVAPRTSSGALATAGSNPAGSAPTANPVLIGSWDGTTVRTVRSDGYGNPIFLDFVDGISFGLIPGATTGTVNGYIGTAAVTTVAIRATSYIADTVAAQRSVVSSSANDSSAGTGARTIKITYYDNSVNGPFTETITMNGTSAVNTTNTNIRFIEKIEVMTVGSTGANAGTISLKQNTGGGGSTLGSIAVSDNSTYWAHHYVPAGKTAHVYAVRAGATITNGIVNLMVTGDPTQTNLPTKNFSNGIRMGSANQVVSYYEWISPLIITGPNFIFLNTKPDAVTASTVYGSFDYSEF